MKTEKLVDLLMAILSAMPPEGAFCAIVKSLATTDSWADAMGADYDTAKWDEDRQSLIDDLKAKFGDEVEMEEVINEWNKQAGF